jgi:hypothetical protein
MKTRGQSGQAIAEYGAVLAVCATIIAVAAIVMNSGLALDIQSEFGNCAQAQGNMAHLAGTHRD